jgi:hypothetical protein
LFLRLINNNFFLNLYFLIQKQTEMKHLFFAFMCITLSLLLNHIGNNFAAFYSAFFIVVAAVYLTDEKTYETK